MEHDFIHKAVYTKLHQIRKHAEAGAAAFDNENIHEMRTGYKKLRAFLRLLSFDEKIVLPAGLKQIYRAAAPLRDLQLYRKEVESFSKQTTTAYPFAYINTLSEQIEKAEQHFAKVVKDTDFDEIKTQIEEQLTGTFPVLTFENFIRAQENAVHEIMQQVKHEDEDLHNARKHLKDVMYNITILENEERLPGHVYEGKEKQLKNVTDALGDHNDLSFFLNRLDKHLPDWKAKDDHDTLLQLQLQWTEEKLVRKTLAENALKTYS